MINVMVSRANEMSAIGTAVAANIRWIREYRGYSLRALQQRLAALGHNLNHTALANIESGKRRVDVDDVAAIADALGVAVLGLMTPLRPMLERNILESAPSEIPSERVWEDMAGQWPAKLPKPVRNHEQLLRLADYWLFSTPKVRTLMMTSSFEVEGQEPRKPNTPTGVLQEMFSKQAMDMAIGAQIRILEARIEQQANQWESVRADQVNATQDEHRHFVAELWTELTSEAGHAQKSLTRALLTKDREDLTNRVHKVEDANLELRESIVQKEELVEVTLGRSKLIAFPDGTPLVLYRLGLGSGEFDSPSEDLDQESIEAAIQADSEIPQESPPDS